MKLVSQYFDQNNRPKLMPSFCAFVDILGFKDICKEAFKQNQGDVVLNRIHKILSYQNDKMAPKLERKISRKAWEKIIESDVVQGKEALREMLAKPKPKRAPYKPNWDVSFFTDNIVFGQIINSSDGETEIGFVLFEMMLHQLLLVKEGFFIRGGISIGELFIDKNVVFGPALIDSYNLESKAIYPRIVLAKNLLPLITKYFEYYGEPFDSPENNHILIDSDGQPFLNYLSLLFDGTVDTANPWDYLIQQKQNIELCLLKFKSDPHLTTKYEWLANYHNFICKQYHDYPGYSKECIINATFSIKNPHRIIRRRTKSPVSLG